MSCDAFITAGGLLHGEMKERAGTSVKALVKIGERTLLEGTIAAPAGQQRHRQDSSRRAGRARRLSDAAGYRSFHRSGSLWCREYKEGS
ncbi:MAG: hypothetical protein AB2L14_11485 [Candidatus Xenobiia bacterium LiM19]